MTVARHHALATARALHMRLRVKRLFARTSLPELLHALERGADGEVRAPDSIVAIVDGALRPLRFWNTTCLWRALAGFATLRAGGHDVVFVIGVRRRRGELEAHAWLERDGDGSIGAPTADDGFTIAYRYPDPGRVKRNNAVTSMPITVNEDVVLSELPDGTGVLLHLGTKMYHTLNRAGVIVWRALEESGAASIDAPAVRLSSEYPDVDPSAIRADVEQLIAALASEKLVHVR